MTAVPCGSHDVDFKGDECMEMGAHPKAAIVFCWLEEGHDGPHWDKVDGHWQASEDGTIELSRCQKVVSAQ